MLARTYHAADTKQMSFLFFLFYLHTCDTFESLMGIKNAAQAYRVIGGLHGVAAKLAGELGPVIVLEAPVQAISQDTLGIAVHSQNRSWHADCAIVAVPLPLSVRIAYDPPLPPHRDVLAQRMPMGSVIKYWVAYDRPFWREHGWNGITLSDLPPRAGCYDCTPPEGKPGLLVGFIEADKC
jgi:monoamine oxidase